VGSRCGHYRPAYPRLAHRVTGSPEAQVAAAAWQFISTDVTSALFASASGRELTERGYAEDVTIAAEVDRSRSVPLLREHRFVAA